MTKTNKPGKVIGLKIERSRPEDSPKNLAIKLASFLNEEINARNDAKNFQEQASREREKARKFGDILVMLREYKKKKEKAIVNGERWEPSRMEVMETYDEISIKEERLMLIERAKNLDSQAKEFEKIAERAKREVMIIQKKLQQISNN